VPGLLSTTEDFGRLSPAQNSENGVMADSYVKSGSSAGAGGAEGQAPDIGSELMTAVRDGANAFFEEQRDRVADEMATLSSVLRRAALSLDKTDSGAVLRYADQAADGIGSLADGLRRRSWDELVAEVEGFSQRWPMAFLASAGCAGWLVGRFLAVTDPRAGGDPPVAAASVSSPTTLPATPTAPPATATGAVADISPRAATGAGWPEGE
jgi:hypothetical protein